MRIMLFVVLLLGYNIRKVFLLYPLCPCLPRPWDNLRSILLNAAEGMVCTCKYRCGAWMLISEMAWHEVVKTFIQRPLAFGCLNQTTQLLSAPRSGYTFFVAFSIIQNLWLPSTPLWRLLAFISGLNVALGLLRTGRALSLAWLFRFSNHKLVCGAGLFRQSTNWTCSFRVAM